MHIYICMLSILVDSYLCGHLRICAYVYIYVRTYASILAVCGMKFMYFASVLFHVLLGMRGSARCSFNGVCCGVAGRVCW